MLLLSTPWHTGTQYMMQEMAGRGFVQRHCGVEVLCDIDAAKHAGVEVEIVTTFRDPLDVMASWANKYSWPEVRDEWISQWRAWGKLLEMGARVAHVAGFTGPVVKPGPDRRGAKLMVKRGIAEANIQLFPPDLLKHAREIVAQNSERLRHG